MVVLGEAAMLSAQVTGQRNQPMGMNVPERRQPATGAEHHALAVGDAEVVDRRQETVVSKQCS